MSTLVDSNILVRLSENGHPDQADCEQALERLLKRNDRAFLCAQAAIEYWAVATRPKALNGLGLGPVEAEKGLREAEHLLVWLDEPVDIGMRWRRLVNRYAVIGKQVHDARLVALMEAHGLTTMLTLNTADFRRYTHITSLLPSQVT